MGRIVLHSGIPNLLEKVNPLNNLIKEVSEDNCLSGLPGVSPPLLDALLFGCFREFM
jgi:hypothetical protein